MKRRQVRFSPKGLDALMTDSKSPFEGTFEGHPLEEHLFAYATGTLQPDDRRRVHEHLDICPTCTFRLDVFETAAQAWEGPSGTNRLRALTDRLRSSTQREFVFSNDGEPRREAKEEEDGSAKPQSDVPTGRRIDFQENV